MGERGWISRCTTCTSAMGTFRYGRSAGSAVSGSSEKRPLAAWMIRPRLTEGYGPGLADDSSRSSVTSRKHNGLQVHRTDG